MNLGGKRSQRSSWWASSAERPDWLSVARAKAGSKTSAERANTAIASKLRKIER